jgi:hypothetical protein
MRDFIKLLNSINDLENRIKLYEKALMARRIIESKWRKIEISKGKITTAEQTGIQKEEFRKAKISKTDERYINRGTIIDLEKEITVMKNNLKNQKHEVGITNWSLYQK